MKQHAAALVAFVATLAVLVGCGGANSNDQTSAIEATWQYSSVSTTNPVGGPANCPASLPIGTGTDTVGCGTAQQITFSSDGTYFTNDTPVKTGSWISVGSQLVLNDGTKETSGQYQINGNLFTFTYASEGTIVSYVLNKV